MKQRADGSSGEQLFRVVYDPVSDRFLLQDNEIDGVRSKRTSTAARARDERSDGIPWEQWVLPPRSTSKDRTQHLHHHRAVSEPAPLATSVSPPATSPTTLSADRALGEAMGALELKSDALAGERAVELATDAMTPAKASRPVLPELDFSALATLSVDPSGASSKKSSMKKPATTLSAKKTRVRDYTAHFANANVQLPLGISRVATLLHQDGIADEKGASCEEPTWNSEPLRVKVACVGHLDMPPDAVGVESSDQVQERGVSGIQHVFELAQLSRIRSQADGFRDAEVNSGCSFAPLTSSSSSEDEVQEASSSSFSDEDTSALPVFQRGDRVLFRAKHRRFKGTIARRVSTSSFYDVRAANGTLFSAVSASRIRLLPPVAQEPPPFDFQRGDRVLWLPTQAGKAQSYKARVLRLRSLDRFDIELRTGRVRRKVPYAELRPAL